MKKYLTPLVKRLSFIGITLAMLSQSVAGTLEISTKNNIPTPKASANTGNAGSEAAADDVLDLVFLIDTSGSMEPTAQSISRAMGNLANNLSCGNNSKLFVKNRFIGIGTRRTDIFSSTLFDESLSTVLGSTLSFATDHIEDNAPAVNDIISHYNFSTPQAGKDYFKAIITIGDEGTDNGEPVNQADYDAAHLANQAAINDNVYLFSMPVNTSIGASIAILEPLYEAMSEGSNGSTFNGHVFGDTGGESVLFDPTSSTAVQTLEREIERIMCSFVSPPPPSATTQAVPSLSLFGIFASLILLASLSINILRKRK